MKITALLPMKGNSERVPNKNLRDFNGKPLFFHVLKALNSSRYIDEIIINTDSKQISRIALEEFSDSVIIHDRVESILGDMVSMNEIINYDLSVSKSDFYIQTHSTNPLLKTESIDKAIEKMILLHETKKNDSVFSVTKLQTRLYTQDVQPFNHNPNELLRTQDLEPLYEENSNFYIFSKESFKESGGKRIGVSPYMFELDKIEAVDIDEPEDFIIAESLHKLLR
ncbi:cytidylyltransferase domain-containing protein [Tenacibaculum insulae]|uniref:acylneuraminate cytidylyltransferase family protein n=1 Tax=Tenacibaculum insulae TaxID=2029677 RepID=UPI003AB145B5